MNQILLFAGTTEGRILAEYLNEQQIATHVCVATEYGEYILSSLLTATNKTLTPPSAVPTTNTNSNDTNHLTITAERLTCEDMESLMLTETFQMVIDATHPYATVVSNNIQKACRDTNTPYYRVTRETSMLLNKDSHTIFVSNVDEAVEYLSNTTGNIFVTTGSKELHKFTKLPDYENRVYARTLSSPDVVGDCYALGFRGQHLICMQGPFSTDINLAMYRHVNASYLVTKESGLAGGFAQKIEAAREADVTCIIIGRPQDVKGYSLEEMKEIINAI